MLRSLVHSPHAKRFAFPVTVGVLAVLTVLPLRWIGWVGWFGVEAVKLVAPLSERMRDVTGWFEPEARARDIKERSALEAELERYKTLYYRAEQDAEELRDKIAELQQGIALNPDLPVRVMTAPVIAASSDLASAILTVRAGHNHHVEKGTVAATARLQLVGRVVRADDRTCQVQPITSRAAGVLSGVMIFDDPAKRVACRLTAQGDGTLRGPVEDKRDPDTQQPLLPEVGQIVRLADTEWPKNAQMLVIGRVESVVEAADQPLRKIVIVRPELRPERVSEVLLRITPETEDDPRGPGRGAGGGP